MRAAIDVGTNSVRLLIGTVRGRAVVPSSYLRCVTRLGGGSSAQKGLAPDAMERTLFALQEMVAALHRQEISLVRAVGTEALRRAVNGEAFSRRIRQELGLPLEIISGAEEARLTATGVLAALVPVPERCLIFDLGGGSTEFILWQAGQIRFRSSYPLGVVRLAEGSGDEQAQLQVIGEVVATLQADLQSAGVDEVVMAADCFLVGTAGTVTTLAALELAMAEYDGCRINNFALHRDALQSWIERLTPLSVAEREALPGLEPGRGDLIVPGLRVVLVLLSALVKERLVVSDFGLLEGVLLEMSEAS